MKNRDYTLDILRGIAILFVIFGHIQRFGGNVTDYIWSFHIPLFFFISGMLFRPDKYLSFKSFLKLKVIGLILPYAFFYLVSYIYWVLIERQMRGGDIPIWQYMIGLPFGTYDVRYNDFNGSLWFLPALFSVEIIYFFIDKLKKKLFVLLALVTLFAVGYYYRDLFRVFPFGLGAALVSVCFFGFGHLFVKSGLYQKAKTLNVWWQVLIILVMPFIHYFLLPFTGVDLCMARIDNPLFYIPVALVGITGYFFVAQRVDRNKTLEWLGKSSLVLFAFHGQVFRIILFIESKLTHMDVNDVRQNVILCIICLISTILVICPLNYAYNRYVAPMFKKY